MTRSLLMKQAATSLVNTTTLTDDPELFVNLASGKSYLLDVGITSHGYSGIGIKVNLQYTGTLSDGVAHVIWTPYPAGTTYINTSLGATRPASSLTDGTSTLAANGGGNPAERIIYRAYIMLRTTSAGVFKVRWAPQSLHATAATIVHPGSYISVEDISDTFGNGSSTRRSVFAILDQDRSNFTSITFDQFLYLPNLDPGIYDILGVVQCFPGFGAISARLNFEGAPASISRFTGTVTMIPPGSITTGSGANVPKSFDGPIPTTQNLIISGSTAGHRGGYLWNGQLQVATKGDLAILWAQNSLNGNPTNVFKGSFLTAKRIA